MQIALLDLEKPDQMGRELALPKHKTAGKGLNTTVVYMKNEPAASQNDLHTYITENIWCTKYCYCGNESPSALARGAAVALLCRSGQTTLGGT